MKLISAAAIARTKWLNLFEVFYRDHRNLERKWQLATRRKMPKCVTRDWDSPDAVIIIPYHRDCKRLVITREFRVPLGDIEYGFPAGLVDPGESVETAARRELQEETGLEVTTVLEIGPPLYSSAGMTDESVTPIYVECRGTPSGTGNTPNECIEVDLITPQEALDLCINPQLKFDAKAWLILKSFGECGKICPAYPKD
jgi:ADP-ribose pyrophosphatase